MSTFLKLSFFILGIIILSTLQDEVSGAKGPKNSTSSESKSLLLLTPYIKSGKLEEGKMESLIKWGRDSIDGIPSYSGFFTVNETANSNLFFWFVPAMVEDPEDAPVMVWLNGGPGTTSLFGFFVENGPFKVKKRGRIPKLVLRVRKDTWARRHNMLYIDSPVGTGFSFTDAEESYAKTQDDIVRDLYNGLQQFYALFPEFSKQQLYLAGESYAAKTIPRLGMKIHTENQKENSTQMNFKGIITGGPMTDPPTIRTYAEYFHQLGLIDDSARNYMQAQDQLATKLNAQGKLAEATKIKADLINFSPNSYLSNVTGYENFASALETRTHKKRDYYSRFLNQSSTRKLIHVGSRPFNNASSRVLQDLSDDYEKSSKFEMESLINLKYRVLIYVGQMDLITPHVGVANFISSLNFDGKSAYEASERRIIRELKRGEVSGYVKAHDNFYYVIVRNAGHHAPSDEPRWCREIVERFVTGKSDDGDF